MGNQLPPVSATWHISWINLVTLARTSTAKIKKRLIKPHSSRLVIIHHWRFFLLFLSVSLPEVQLLLSGWRNYSNNKPTQGPQANIKWLFVLSEHLSTFILFVSFNFICDREDGTACAAQRELIWSTQEREGKQSQKWSQEYSSSVHICFTGWFLLAKSKIRDVTFSTQLGSNPPKLIDMKL